MVWDAILFDLDGTLWDSSEGIIVSWNQCLSTVYGLTPLLTRSHVGQWMGKLLPDIAVSLFPDRDEEERMRMVRDCVQAENQYLARHGGALYPGVPETLARLADLVPLAIVSNCEDGYIESFFAAHGLEKYFADYEHPGRTGLDKAGNIREVVRRNGWRRPVYVGDTRIDRDAAQAAGVPFIHAGYGFGEAEDAPRLERFSDLPALLEELTA